jgi:predicted secreted Zn-dependent protease
MPAAAIVPTPSSPRSVLAFLLAAFLVVAPLAHAEVEERYSESFYVVNARPDTPLTTLINQASYIRIGGVQYHGSATPDFRSRLFWTTDEDTGLCRMTRVLVNLRIDVRLPRLFEATDAQRAAFERFMAPLRVHEQGHVSRYRATANQMVRELEALPPMADCESLQKAAFSRGNAIIREGSEENARYDAETRHGLNQSGGAG